jgi:hypothetical protein
MRFRHYAVTVMDNWTPMRFFWTLRGARRFYLKHNNGYAHLFEWAGPTFGWQELDG